MSMMNMTDHKEVRSDFESIARVWALAGPLRGKVASGIGYRFLQSIFLGLAFGGVIWVVNDLAAGRVPDTQWVLQVSALMVASLVGQTIFGFLSVSDSWLSSYQVAGRLRLNILDHLSQLPMSFHLSRHQGDTVTALTADMQTLESFMSDALPRIAQAFGLPLAVLAFLFFVDWPIALAGLASMVVALPIFMWTSRYLAKLGIRRQDMQAEAGARMIEYAQGIAVIRAFNRIAKGEESFRAGLKAFHDISIKLVMDLTAPLSLFGAVLMLGVPLVTLLASLRLIEGSIEISALIASLVLIFTLYTPMLGLIAVMELTRMADASLTRIDRIVTAETLPVATQPVDPDGFAVAFKQVDFSYVPGKPILQNLTFTVPERSMTAIVGPSGAGKSTVLNLLPRFWDVTGGHVTIGGVDTRDMAPQRLNELVTMVFQDVYLFAGTIRDNIAFGRPGASAQDVEAAAKSAQAHDFIMALPNGYETRIGEGGSTLSGGERQRISIARAILKDAPIVLLDEATAAIDPSNERAIQTALAQLVADKTLIVVAHKLTTVQAADQIVVIEDGALVESGNHQQLLETNGAYAKLWARWNRAADWRIGGDA